MALSGTIRRMPGESPAVTQWLATPLGRRCLANEQRLSRQALERVFGEQCLQIGAWGARNSFLRYARTQRRALLDWRPGVAADILSSPEQLSVASDSVDVVLLPHIGSASVVTRNAMDQLVVDNLKAWFAGKPPLTPVPETPVKSRG